jgi:hypothetical protein
MHVFMPGEDHGSLLQMVQKYCLLLLSLIAQLPDTNFVSYHTRYYAAQCLLHTQHVHNRNQTFFFVWAPSIYFSKRWIKPRADEKKKKKKQKTVFL